MAFVGGAEDLLGLFGATTHPAGLQLLQYDGEVIRDANGLTVLEAPDAASRAVARRLAATVEPEDGLTVALRELLERVATGEAVVVVRPEQEVTPAGAAELLGVTRQFVDRLLGDGALGFRRLPGSSHRRIKLGDVVALAEERGRRRQGAAAIRAQLEGPAAGR